VEIGVKVNVAPAIGESVNKGVAVYCLQEERDHSTDELWVSVLFDHLIGAAEIRDLIPAALKAAAMIGPGATCGGVPGERDGEHLGPEPPHIFDTDGVPLTRA
jgi:hypothetical protein